MQPLVPRQMLDCILTTREWSHQAFTGLHVPSILLQKKAVQGASPRPAGHPVGHGSLRDSQR
jgi:hypothetical protein